MKNGTVKRNIIVDRGVGYALWVMRLFRDLEKDGVGRVLATQLLRAGTSIGANVHEAQAAQSKADFIEKMSIAHKEARECACWQRLIREAGLLADSRLEDLAQETDELIRILSSILIASKQKAKS